MKKKILIFLLILILFGVYWQWFLPGPRVANDFPLVSNASLKSSMNLPQVWSENGAEGLGGYSVYTLWSYPLVFISGFLANLGVSFELFERILILIPFLFLGAWGIWKLGQEINLSNPAKFIMTVFYLTNTYILLVIDGGQLVIGLAYAWFPISFLAVKKSIKSGVVGRILAGVSVGVLGIFDFRFIYVLILLSLIYFFYEFLFLGKKKWGDWTISWLKSGAVIGLIMVGLNAYWLLPLLQAPLSSDIYTKLTQTTFVSFVTLGHSMMMLAPHWFKNVFGYITQLRFEFVLIPILVFLAPILRPKDRVVGFWLLVAIIFVFLTKGASEPLTKLYPWLFSNVLGFSLFRDSSKFFFLVALSYTILLGITVDEITKRFNSYPKIKIAFILSLTCYLLFLIKPVWLGQMTGTFSSPPLQLEYSKVAEVLENDTEFSRIFWIPSIPSLGFLHPNHPSVEAARLAQKRPFAVGIKGTYETFNFLREAPYIGEIFDVAGIGYIAYPPLDPRRANMHPDNIKYFYTFSNQLSNLSWLSKVDDSSIHLWKVNQYQDKFFIVPNIWWVIGSDSIYNEATKSAQLKLSKNALIFVEEYSGLGDVIDELPEAQIVLNDKTMTDLAASFINPSNLIFPAKKLDFDPDSSGWWKREAADLIRWRDFLQTKYGIDNQDFDLGGGWAIGEGNLKLIIDNGQLKKGNILLARVLESTRSGELKFYQDGKLIGQIDTKQAGNNIRWFEVGELKSSNELTIQSRGDINVVNALAVLDKNEWLNYQDKAVKLQGRIVDFDEKNAKNGNSPAIIYRKINPTKYMVNISNLSQPAFLIFSQNYDSLWKMNGLSSLPVYSLLNGFKIDQDGEYIVEFEAQKYVYPGLIISGITILLIILFLTRKSSGSKL